MKSERSTHVSFSFEDVLKSELDAINERREKADQPRSDGEDLVGLSLSGGGIRSAMFNLGLLQSLHKSKVMDQIDYLASVSGGGYIAGYYSSLGNQPKGLEKSEESRPPSGADSAESQRQDTEEHCTGLHATDGRFLMEGQYLNRPLTFFSVYITQTAFMLLMYLSVLFFAGSSIALFFRVIDYPEVRANMGFIAPDTDLVAALVGILAINVVYLFGFLVAWIGYRFFGQTIRFSSSRFLSVAIGSALLGFMVMMGNGDFNISSVSGGLLPSSITWQSHLQLPLTAGVFLAFLPLLRFRSLLKSEREDASLWQRLALKCVLFLTIGGGTLAIIGFLARENISTYVNRREPKLIRDDILEDRAFVTFFEKTIGGNDNTRKLRETANRQDSLRKNLFPSEYRWNGWFPGGARNLIPLSTDWLRRVGLFLSYNLGLDSKEGGGHGNEVRQSLQIWSDGNKARDKLVDQFNFAYFPDNPLTATTDELTQPLLKMLEDNLLSVVKETKFSEEALQAYIDKVEPKPLESNLFMELFRRSCLPKITTQSGTSGASGVSFTFEPKTLTPLETQRFRRLLLELAEPHIFKRRAMVSTPVVIANDQECRKWWCIWSLVAFVAVSLVLDFNKQSPIRNFYQQTLVKTFLQRDRSRTNKYLSEINPHRFGNPYPLFLGALRLIDPASGEQDLQRSNPKKIDDSVGSEWYSFLMSPLYCGWMPVGPKGAELDRRQRQPGEVLKTYCETKGYLGGQFKFSDAIAISGAALTPYMASNSALVALMHAFNLRLEQWLPNPAKPSDANKQKFVFWTLVREWLRSKLSHQAREDWDWGIVADGGFREFLGVEELLARRCKIIISSDAGCNNGLFEFGVLADLVRKARLDHQIELLDLDHELPLDASRLRHQVDSARNVAQHFIVGRIRYPDKETVEVRTPEGQIEKQLVNKMGLFVYLQMTLTGDEDIDLQQFRKTNPTFPDEPIANQFYTKDQVESLRQLGEHIGRLISQEFSTATVLNGGSSGATSNRTSNRSKNEVQLRQQRILNLETTFRAAYQHECKLETAISVRDVQAEWYGDRVPADDRSSVTSITPAVLQLSLIRQEQKNDYRHKISRFVFDVLDRDALPDGSTVSPGERMEWIPAWNDLPAVLVECNRRYAGFRSEAPKRYFQIGGRERAIEEILHLLNSLVRNPNCDGGKDDSNDERRVRVKLGLCRFASSVPRSVFREHGKESVADFLACVIKWSSRNAGDDDFDFSKKEEVEQSPGVDSAAQLGARQSAKKKVTAGKDDGRTDLQQPKFVSIEATLSTVTNWDVLKKPWELAKQLRRGPQIPTAAFIWSMLFQTSELPTPSKPSPMKK